ncbi:MAG: GTP cyclohydrolase II [Proteobacteria bacterium]|nr:GTP cyclohydrolase II [Pseudomonadota bacterium]MYB89708.1 GTP cyclohydrolase II [Pseudomonadota bacterium]
MSTREPISFSTIPEALVELRRGNVIIVVDDDNRENEGDFVGAADKCTPDMINFMATEGRGLICTAITEQRAEEIGLKLMVPQGENDSLHTTSFTVSVDLKHGTTTGISTADRAKTVKALADSNITQEDFSRPGHIFPLRAVDGGVFQREGHTEAAVDLMGLAGMRKAGVLCEVLKEDGSMARLPDLMEIAERFSLKIIAIKDLIRYKLRFESRVERVVTVQLPTRWGEFELIAFRDNLTGKEHLALVKGSWDKDDDVLVRIHSECLTGDVFGSARCDCGDQIQTAMKVIQEHDCGVVLYMREEGRGIGLVNKLKAYSLQECGFDTVQANRALGFDADERDHSVAAHILHALHIERVQLLTNNPNKCSWIENFGIKLVRRIPILSYTNNQFRKKYLKSKQEKLGHIITMDTKE